MVKQIPEGADVAGFALSKVGLGGLQETFTVKLFYDSMTCYFQEQSAPNFLLVCKQTFIGVEDSWNLTPCNHRVKLLLIPCLLSIIPYSC